MDWNDEGVIVSLRGHGETSAIIEVLTATHGRHAGIVRGGASRRMKPVLQPGTQVALSWHARLEEHLGSFRVEPLRSRTRVLSDRAALAGLGSVCALVRFAFPERMDLPALYDATVDLIDKMEADENWAVHYALWEMDLLDGLGYGLDLSGCAVTGATGDLVWVSPKTGRAVSRAAGEEWRDRLLPLPAFLRDATTQARTPEVMDALKTTGYFLERWLAPALGDRPLPEARLRLIAALVRMQAREEGG
jgi:DNA repair protein RecO (recombination protein O)